jgi:transposase
MSEPAALTPPSRPDRSRAAVRAAWVDRLQRFPDSGLSPAQFCAAEGVSLPSFYSWKRRLAAESAGPAPQPARADDAGPRLLAVRLSPPAAAVEVVLPSGAVLRLPPGCDLAFVRALLQALGELPC